MNLLPLVLSDDEDTLILNYAINRNRKRRRYIIEKSIGTFEINELTDDYCCIHFRFKKLDLRRLCLGLKIPELIRCNNGITVLGMEGLCILLKRLAYPNRQHDMMRFFPRTRCAISRICSQMVRIIMQNAGHLLKSLDQPWLTMDKVQEYADVLVNAGSPYAECFGFVDGTVRPTCRPKQLQREYYNGHKRQHAIKFQSVTIPNRLIVHLSDAVVGRRHDGYLLQVSGVLPQLQARFFSAAGRPYHLYADHGYPLSTHLITPFNSHVITPARRECNRAMSAIRESVEWGFKDVIQKFAFLDFKKNLKVGLQPVHELYLVAAILNNCHCCLYKNQTSLYFKCDPPTLEEYLSQVR